MEIRAGGRAFRAAQSPGCPHAVLYMKGAMMRVGPTGCPAFDPRAPWSVLGGGGANIRQFFWLFRDGTTPLARYGPGLGSLFRIFLSLCFYLFLYAVS